MSADNVDADATAMPTTDYMPGTVSLPLASTGVYYTTSTVDSPPSNSLARVEPRATARYELREEIARGGMGAVYAARDTTFNRELAIKVLRNEFLSRPTHVRRFVAEGEITGQLQHPGIPPIYDLGSLGDGRPFLAMKLIRGRTFDELLRARSGPAEERGRFVVAFEQVCQAVGYAHSRGVIHRDLKPANVMVGAFGEVQVMDWGLAKILPGGAVTPPPAPDDPVEVTTAGAQTGAGSVLGTPPFMPPEQARGELDRVDQRADVFGLGSILVVILTGSPPYVGPDTSAVLSMAASGELAEAFARLDGCGADLALVALAKSCLAPDPADRPTDAGAVATVVAAFRADVEERAKQAELELAKRRLRQFEVIRRWRTLVLTLLMVGSMLAWWYYCIQNKVSVEVMLSVQLVLWVVNSVLGWWLITRPERTAGYRTSDLWARDARVSAEPGAAADRGRM